MIFPSVMAVVTCPACNVNSCQCSISDCGSGSIDIYSTQTCQGNPLFEYTFTGGNFPWFPTNAGSYYMTAFCDDGRTKSICSPVVASSGTNTGTQTSSGTSSFTETISTTQTSGGGSNTLLYVLVVVIIAVIAFIAYRLFFRKKKAKVDYESLYRKWGR